MSFRLGKGIEKALRISAATILFYNPASSWAEELPQYIPKEIPEIGYKLKKSLENSAKIIDSTDIKVYSLRLTSDFSKVIIPFLKKPGERNKWEEEVASLKPMIRRYLEDEGEKYIVLARKMKKSLDEGRGEIEISQSEKMIYIQIIKKAKAVVNQKKLKEIEFAGILIIPKNGKSPGENKASGIWIKVGGFFDRETPSKKGEYLIDLEEIMKKE